MQSIPTTGAGNAVLRNGEFLLSNSRYRDQWIAHFQTVIPHEKRDFPKKHAAIGLHLWSEIDYDQISRTSRYRGHKYVFLKSKDSKRNERGTTFIDTSQFMEVTCEPDDDLFETHPFLMRAMAITQFLQGRKPFEIRASANTGGQTQTDDQLVLSASCSCMSILPDIPSEDREKLADPKLTHLMRRKYKITRSCCFTYALSPKYCPEAELTSMPKSYRVNPTEEFVQNKLPANTTMTFTNHFPLTTSKLPINELLYHSETGVRTEPEVKPKKVYLCRGRCPRLTMADANFFYRNPGGTFKVNMYILPNGDIKKLNEDEKLPPAIKGTLKTYLRNRMKKNIQNNLNSFE
eukprot:Lithocolla_globosa_v1_NODE_3_length_14236_cov_22.745998.p4 type:complete len:348 gc:universal NODE_3_length_14236_cov_22.745998:8295-7252(-)